MLPADLDADSLSPGWSCDRCRRDVSGEQLRCPVCDRSRIERERELVALAARGRRAA